MAGALAPILVCVTPNLGQTYSALPIQIMSTTIGASFAYSAVISCGKTQYAIVGFAAVLGIPCFYLMLLRPTLSVFGLLTLLSFSNYVCITFANSTNPLFDSDLTYLYKVVAVAAIALTFSLVFSLLLYPTLARQVLREKIHEIFREMSVYYRKILLTSVNAEVSVNIEDVGVLETRNSILAKLAALQPLMEFTVVEPRMEGPFQYAKYEELIDRIYRLLDRLECMRVSAGEQVVDPD
ncbi:hypothetical protein HK100_004139, partial [Physocladia obscura]